ncbi:hypothetical protein ACOSP7_006761 [Xanthoceras sorbifolium]
MIKPGRCDTTKASAETASSMVCPARFDGHSQGTVRFGSSGVAPPQRPHGFASPPPNQDLNQLLILKY